MTETLRDYVIESRWLEPGQGWRKQVRRAVDTTLEKAWGIASQEARKLDEKYGDSQYWNVYVKNPEGEAYVELFHGRLS